jgi:hypothetical protein
MEKGSSARKHRLPRWAKWVLGILAALAALYFGPDLVLRYRIHSELAAIRAEGLPVTVAEYSTWCGQPPGEKDEDFLKRPAREVLTLSSLFRSKVDVEEAIFADPEVRLFSHHFSDGLPLPYEAWAFDCETGAWILAARLSDNHLSAREMQEITQAYAEAETRHSAFRAIVGVRCELIDRFAGPAEQLKIDYELMLGNTYRTFYCVTHLKRLDHLACLQATRRWLQVAQLPSRERAKVAANWRSGPPDAGFWLHPNASYAEERMGRAMRAEFRAIMNVHMAQIALAIEQHRLATGTLPESLSDIAPEVAKSLPSGVMEEGLFRYARRGGGYRIVCVESPDQHFIVSPSGERNRPSE